MKISIIVAMQTNRGIGCTGRIPWHISADLQNFKRITMGHHLIQGRITWESIGRPLPGRHMVVVTRQAGYEVPDGVDVVGSLEAALDLARSRGEDDAFIGGGAGVYQAALPIATHLYLTRVEAAEEADTFFPEFDRESWRLVEEWRHEADERNDFPFTYQKLERI